MENNIKTVIVTGASSGVGEALVRTLARAGCTVCAIARTKTKLQGLVRAGKGRVEAWPADIADPAATQNVFAAIQKKHTRIDALVNNAGIYNTCEFYKESFEVIDNIINTNLKGTLYCTRCVLPGMVKRKRGWVVNISSVSGIRGIPGQAVYGASKHGMNGFSEVIAQELLPKGVLVTSICPGGIATPLWNPANPYPGDANNLIKPQEIVDLVMFILKQPARTLYKRVVLFPTGEWH